MKFIWFVKDITKPAYTFTSTNSSKLNLMRQLVYPWPFDEVLRKCRSAGRKQENRLSKGSFAHSNEILKMYILAKKKISQLYVAQWQFKQLSWF